MKLVFRGCALRVLAAFLLMAGHRAAFGQAGSNDPTFEPGSGANGAIFGLALQADGKVLAVGTSRISTGPLATDWFD